jgi:hypothetical protein
MLSFVTFVNTMQNDGNLARALRLSHPQHLRSAQLEGRSINGKRACFVQVLGLSSNKLSDNAMEALTPELLNLAPLRRVRLDHNSFAKWSGDWGTGSVGKDVL